jgi:DNA primase
VRFRIERELEAGDLGSAEGKDRVIEELRPAFATLPPSALREELLAHVADRLDLAPSLVSSWLPAPGSAPAGRNGGGSNGGGGHRPSAPAPMASPRSAAMANPLGRAERAFLAQCLATPDAAAEVLANLPEDTFSNDTMRRVAAHVRDHLHAPEEGLDGDDEVLTRAIAALVADAASLAPSRAALQGQLANVQLLRIDRLMKAAIAAGEGGVVELRRRRDHLEERRNALIQEAMEESSPDA